VSGVLGRGTHGEPHGKGGCGGGGAGAGADPPLRLEELLGGGSARRLGSAAHAKAARQRVIPDVERELEQLADELEEARAAAHPAELSAAVQTQERYMVELMAEMKG
jgi:hypothetical protein